MLDQEVRKIIYLAEEIANIPFGSIKSKSRKRDIVLARHCVGAMLVSGLGIHKQKASELMQRDRTSFNVYQKKHEEYMENPKIYPDYNMFYDKLLQTYFDNEALLKNPKTREWYEQLDTIKNQQKSLHRKLLLLEQECKLLGL